MIILREGQNSTVRGKYVADPITHTAQTTSFATYTINHNQGKLCTRVSIHVPYNGLMLYDAMSIRTGGTSFERYQYGFYFENLPGNNSIKVYIGRVLDFNHELRPTLYFE